MLHIIKRPHARQVNLRALAVRLPVLAPLLEHLARMVVHITDLDDLHALALRPVDLAPDRLVRLRRVHLSGVDALLRNSDDSGPPELRGEVALSRLVHAAPHGLEALFVQEREIRFDDTWDLFFCTEGAAEGDREPVLGDVADRRTRRPIPPYGPSRIRPARVRRVTVLRDELGRHVSFT